MADVAVDYLALRDRCGAAAIRRDVVRVFGADAMTFLHGQLSQDIAALPVGDAAWSLLLQPQGKVDAFVRVVRAGDEEVVLDVDAGFGRAVVARLQRFKLRTRCEFELVAVDFTAVRGPDADPVQGALPSGWAAGGGYDLAERPTDPVHPDAFERLRIEAGAPRMGAELDDRTIPAEAGIVAVSVSFTKGCFTGQELVARIDSRGGNVPRHLRGIRVDGDVTPPPGATVVVEAGGKPAGSLTSVAPPLPGISGHDGAVALAYIARAVTVPTRATLEWDGGTAGAEVLALPMVP